MNQKIIIILITMSLLGCSAKNSASKNGAILGTTAGAMAGGVMGLAVTASKSNSQDFTKNAIIGAVVVGAIGYLTGSAMGYVVDKTSNTKTKEIEKMAQSQKIVNKRVKHVPMTTPEAINNAQISNNTVEHRKIEDLKAQPSTQSMQIIQLDTLSASPMPEIEPEESSVSPIEETSIQSDTTESIDMQNGKTLW